MAAMPPKKAVGWPACQRVGFRRRKIRQPRRYRQAPRAREMKSQGSTGQERRKASNVGLMATRFPVCACGLEGVWSRVLFLVLALGSHARRRLALGPQVRQEIHQGGHFGGA